MVQEVSRSGLVLRRANRLAVHCAVVLALMCFVAGWMIGNIMQLIGAFIPKRVRRHEQEVPQYAVYL